MISQRSSFVFILLGSILLFLLMRLWFLYVSGEFIAHDEELLRGALAYDWTQGLNFPLNDYRQDDYCGGTLVSGFLASRYFLFFGPSLFAFKLAPLTMALVAFITALFFLKRFFGERALRAGAFLIIFCPSTYVCLSLVGNGDHAESLVLILPMVFAFYELVFSQKRKALMAICLGIFAGFGVWFIPTVLSAIAALMLTWVLVNPRTLFSRYGFLAMAAFAAGLLPWYLYNAPRDFPSFLILSDFFKLGSTTLDLSLFWIFPLSFFVGVESNIMAVILSFFYTLMSTLILYFVFRKVFVSKDENNVEALPESKKLTFFIIYFVIHLTISSLASVNFRQFGDFMAFRYFAPLYFLFLVFIGAAVSRMPRGIFVILPLVAIGLFGQVPFLFSKSAGSSLKFKGYSYLELGGMLAQRDVLPNDPMNRYEEYQKRWSREEARFLFWGVMTEAEGKEGGLQNQESLDRVSFYDRAPLLEARGYQLAEEASGELNELYDHWAQSSAQDKPYLLRGYSMAWAAQEHDVKKMAHLSGYGEEVWGYLGFSMGSWRYKLRGEIDWNSDDFRRNDTTFQTGFLRGTGAALAHRCLVDVKPRLMECFEPLQHLSGKELEEVYWGVGWGYCEAWFEDQIRAKSRIAKLYPEMKVSSQKGYDACVDWYHLEK